MFGFSRYYAISQLARHYYQKKQPTKAKELLLRDIRYDELKSLDYDLLGKIYREEGNYTEALKMLDIAIAKSKENWEIDWYNDLKKKLKH